MKVRRVEVNDSADLIGSPGGAVLLIQNVGAVDCYLGESDVDAGSTDADTSGDGFLLAAGGALEISDEFTDIYAITRSSSTVLHLMFGSQ